MRRVFFFFFEWSWTIFVVRILFNVRLVWDTVIPFYELLLLLQFISVLRFNSCILKIQASICAHLKHTHTSLQSICFDVHLKNNCHSRIIYRWGTRIYIKINLCKDHRNKEIEMGAREEVTWYMYCNNAQNWAYTIFKISRYVWNKLFTKSGFFQKVWFDFQISKSPQKNIPKKLSWAWNLNFPTITVKCDSFFKSPNFPQKIFQKNYPELEI